MLSNLWLLGFSFLADILITLGFISYAWIYLDAFIAQKQQKDAFRSIGGILLAIYFAFNIFNYSGNLSDLYAFQLLMFNVGLFAIYYGNLLEPIPLLPNTHYTKQSSFTNYIAIIIFMVIGGALAFLNTVHELNETMLIISTALFLAIIVYVMIFKKQILESDASQDQTQVFKRRKSLSLLLLIVPIYTAPLLAILITYQNLKKVRDGLSNEFLSLAWFWRLLTLFVAYQTLYVLGKSYFTFIDEFTREYSTLWVLGNVLLIICGFLIFQWIAFFISFRITTRIFIYIWRTSILLTIFIASAFSAILITSSESQISDLLTKNASLIQFGFDNVRQSNTSMLNLLASQSNIRTSLVANDLTEIEKTIDSYAVAASNTDKIQLVSASGALIFDSEDPTLEGVDMRDNDIIASTIYFRKEVAAFTKEQLQANHWELTYQFSYPILDDSGNLLGILTSYKRIDDNYLDLIKKQTGQELVIYVNQKKTATTILQSDNISRVENVPLVTDGLISKNDTISFYRSRLLTTPYYLAIVDISDGVGNKFANVVIGTKQSEIIQTAENSIFSIFVLSLGLTLVATIPSYYLARNLKKSIRA